MHNECQFSAFEGLYATFEGSSNFSYNAILLTFILIGVSIIQYRVHARLIHWYSKGQGPQYCQEGITILLHSKTFECYI